jgi:hypothetical protein
LLAQAAQSYSAGLLTGTDPVRHKSDAGEDQLREGVPTRAVSHGCPFMYSSFMRSFKFGLRDARDPACMQLQWGFAFVVPKKDGAGVSRIGSTVHTQK